MDFLNNLWYTKNNDRNLLFNSKVIGGIYNG